MIGRGGLLGRNVEGVLAATGSSWPLATIDWSTPFSSADGLSREVRRFVDECGTEPWNVAWCAGAGFVGADNRGLAVERAALAATLDSLAHSPQPERGNFFFASSAGGVYAGVGAPPYDEYSPVHPLSNYGTAKLDGEALVIEWSRSCGAAVLIGRIANLYGPGQNLTKAQGIISQVCRSYLTGRPAPIYVPLDTIRDYVFAPDCARLVVDGLERLQRERTDLESWVVIKILASQRAVTIGAVLGEMRRIFKGSIRIVVAASALSTAQVQNLSVRSRVWTELDRRPLTPLPVGVARTVADVLRHLQRGDLAA